MWLAQSFFFAVLGLACNACAHWRIFVVVGTCVLLRISPSDVCGGMYHIVNNVILLLKS